MKRYKLVAPASAAKPQAVQECPSITKHQMIANVWSKQKEAMERCISEFKKSVEEDGCVRAMICKGDAAMFAEAFLYETRGMESFISQKEPTESEDISRIRDRFEQMLGAAVAELIGDFQSSDDGPWVDNSELQMSSLNAVQKANAKRRLVRMYTELLRCIDE